MNKIVTVCVTDLNLEMMIFTRRLSQFVSVEMSKTVWTPVLQSTFLVFTKMKMESKKMDRTNFILIGVSSFEIRLPIKSHEVKNKTKIKFFHEKKEKIIPNDINKDLPFLKNLENYPEIYFPFTPIWMIEEKRILQAIICKKRWEERL